MLRKKRKKRKKVPCGTWRTYEPRRGAFFAYFAFFAPRRGEKPCFYSPSCREKSERSEKRVAGAGPYFAYFAFFAARQDEKRGGVLMNPTILVGELAARGIRLSVNGEAIRVEPASALTDEARQAIRDHKADLLVLLSQPPAATDRPRIGTAARPMVVRGDWIGECLWDNCDGALIARRWGKWGSLIQCKKCGAYFE